MASGLSMSGKASPSDSYRQSPVTKPKLIKLPKIEFSCRGIVSFKTRFDEIRIVPAANEKKNRPIMIVQMLSIRVTDVAIRTPTLHQISVFLLPYVTKKFPQKRPLVQPIV